MSSCLSGLVGVRGCGGSTAEFAVNDLTGINIPDFDKAISVEKQSASSALTGIVEFATKEVENQIRSHLANKYHLKTFIENDVVGYFHDNKEEVSAQSGYLVGYEVRIDNMAYLNYYLHSLRLFVNTTGTVNVVVYDLIQGKLLDTIPVSAVAGEVVDVTCDKTYSTKKQRLRLFIGYLSSFDSFKTSYLNPNFSLGRYERCDDVTCGDYFNNNVYYRAAKILNASEKVYSNVESNTYCGGLSLNYSLQCSFTEYICNARNQFALPILYKAGEKIMMELKHSKRLTNIVTVYAQNHEDLMLYYRTEHEKLMNDLIKGIVLPESVCFECDKKVKTAVRLP